MSCQDMLLLIEKLADGECTPSEKARAEAHLESCESCRAHYRFLEALPDAARKAPLPEPPEMYWEVLPGKVMARIAQEREAAASPGGLAAWLRPTGLRWLGALAAVVIAALVGLEVWTFRESATPSIAQKQDSELAKPELRSEDAELDRQPVSSAEPAVLEERADQGRRPAPEPSLEDESVDAAPAQARTPAAPKPASLAPAKDQEPGRIVPAAPADQREPTEGLAGKAQVAAVSQDEPAVVTSEEEVAFGLATLPRPAASAPAEGQALQEEPAREKERFLTPVEPARKRRSAAYQTLSTQKSSGEIQTECGDLRALLARDPDAERALETRYQLALCSIRLFKSRPSEDTRQQAIEDGGAFLEASPDGERADEIRKELESIEK